MTASISPLMSIAARSVPGPAGSTLVGYTYVSTCSRPDSTQVTRSVSTPYSVDRMPRAQTPVVTVYPRFTPTRLPSRSAGVRMPERVLYRIAPWWKPRTRKIGSAVKATPCSRAVR